MNTKNIWMNFTQQHVIKMSLPIMCNGFAVALRLTFLGIITMSVFHLQSLNIYR